ncbi:CDP-glucose 4,6-dehydratase [Clostridium sp. JS66]|uniref:CDP-glucose 4,6-dehydratase n=1 Tax=Clostridium sp. JS66 TaxID=3064705 RepID=UPI00298D88FC|nr:CDP-glucose 4,6-dehydratase [Clostridium sp. JS66]WPC42500.1 CDP-glucose 4,6-dehydratase [Clostridium sp. JS66]
MANIQLDLFEDFYKDKNVLITGHCGFKGSWLALWLKELGANVIGYGLSPYTKGDNFQVIKLEDKIIDIRGDIRDLNKLNDIFSTYKPEIIFHLAAQPLVKVSYENPKETYEVNVLGTLNVLEAIKQSETVKVAVMVTTDKCYENKEQMWPYREIDPLGGYDPYSSSKACCEILISSYRNSFFNEADYKIHRKAIASVRAGNVIGGGDWSKDRIIPDCIRALRDSESIKVRNPKAIRPWQHVLEPLCGYLELAKRMYYYGASYCGAWNFGPDFESIVKVSDLVDLIIKAWGNGRYDSVYCNNGQHEANLLNLDCTKSKLLLKWKPRLNIEEAINYTIDWYKCFENGDMYKFDVDQICNYCSLRK